MVSPSREGLDVLDATPVLGDPRLPPRWWNFVTEVDCGYVSPCWLFKVHRDPLGSGYQLFTIGRDAYLAHRHSYTVLVGPIPEGLTIDHLCRRPGCVRPDHLEPVTYAVNIARSWSPAALNAAKEECDKGHPFDDDNTLWRRDGHRACRQCGRDRVNAVAAAARKAAIAAGTYRPPGGLFADPDSPYPCGHERSKANTLVNRSSGGKVCRECANADSRRQYYERLGKPVPPVKRIRARETRPRRRNAA